MEVIDNPNQPLIDALEEISYFYQLQSDKNRANAYFNASAALNSVMSPISSGQEAKQLIKTGIGASISEDIDEFVGNGKIVRLEQLRAQSPELTQVIRTFTRIFGIGPKKALDYYRRGITTIDDLWTKGDLSYVQMKAVIYMEQLEQKISRVEMNVINYEINERLRGIKHEVVGSYRRGKLFSGDIDVLIQEENMNSIHEKLKNVIPYVFSMGNTTLRGIWQMEGFNAHRIDLLIIPEREWSSALLHFTGSKRFNILARQKAKELNLKLNEYGLFNEKGEEYDVRSEEEIFNALGLKYLRPEERTENLIDLK